MADVNVALLVSQTVTEAQSQSRIKMGRDYASFYEAWAVLRQRIEEELQYPSTIRVTVIRETRFTETAV